MEAIPGQTHTVCSAAPAPAATVNSNGSFCSPWKMRYLQFITKITVLYEDLQADSGLSSLGFSCQVPTLFFSTSSQRCHWSNLHFLIFNTTGVLKEAHYCPSWGVQEPILQISKAVIRKEQAAPGVTATSCRIWERNVFSFHVQLGCKRGLWTYVWG